MRVNLSRKVRGRRLRRLAQRHRPSAPAAEFAPQRHKVPVQVIRHRHVERQSGDPRSLGEQHERREHLRYEQRPHREFNHREPHRPVALVSPLVHVQHVIPPHDKVHHEEEHARGGHDGRDEAESQAEHHHHQKNPDFAAHAHATRGVLNRAVPWRHRALEQTQVLPHRPANDPRVRKDQPLHRQVHRPEENEDQEKVTGNR